MKLKTEKVVKGNDEITVNSDDLKYWESKGYKLTSAKVEKVEEPTPKEVEGVLPVADVEKMLVSEMKKYAVSVGVDANGLKTMTGKEVIHKLKSEGLVK